MAKSKLRKALMAVCLMVLSISVAVFSISKIKTAKADFDYSLIHFVYNDGTGDIVINDNSLLEIDFSSEDLIELSLDIKLPEGCEISYFTEITVYGCDYEVQYVDGTYQEEGTIKLYPIEGGKVDIFLSYYYSNATTSVFNAFDRIISFYIVEKTEPASVLQSSVSVDIDENDTFEFEIANKNPYYSYVLIYDEAKMSVEYDQTSDKYVGTVFSQFNETIYIYETYLGQVLNKFSVNVHAYSSFINAEIDLLLEKNGEYTQIYLDFDYPDGYTAEFVLNGMPILLETPFISIKNFDEGNYNVQVNVYDENGKIVKSSALFKYSFGEEVELEKQASIDISFTKSNEGSLSVGDEITISSQYYNYALSSFNSIKWYIDGEIIDETNPIFKKTFLEAKTYAVKVEVLEGEDVVLSCEKDMVIKVDASADMTLSFSQNSFVATTSGSVFTVSALLDQMKLTNYTYSWAIDDTSVAQFFVAPNGSAEVVIRPIKEGACKLIVTVDVGRNSTNIKVCEVELKIIGDIETVSLVNSVSYAKPNEEFVVSVLINDTENVCNVPMSLTAFYNSDELTVLDLGLGKFKLSSEKEGVVDLKAVVNGQEYENSIKCASLPFEEIVKNVLPIIVIVALVVLVLNFVLKKRKSPIDKLFENSQNSVQFVKSVIETLNSNIDSAKINAVAVAGYKKVLKLIDNMIALSNTIALEENADATNVLNSLKALKSKLKATNNASVKNLTKNNHKAVYSKLILAEISKIDENVAIIKSTHDDYAKIQSNLNDLTNKTKETKLSREEIKQKHVEEFMRFAQTDDDDGDDGSN